jgi:zinc protease
MELAADILLRPSFPNDELARYKDRTRAALIQQRANPNFVAGEVFAGAVYGMHPAARRSPTAAALDAVTRDELVEFHRVRYVPDQALLAIAGDITMAEARTIISTRLGDWRKSGTAVPVAQQPAPLAGPKIYFVARPNSVQTSLVVGTQSIQRDDPDYVPLQVMNRIVGGGPTGRLFIHLREEKGYTYGAASALTALRHRGDWQAATNVRTEVTDPALRDLLAELVQIRDQPVSDQELADAKRAMVATFALSLESPATLLGYHTTRWRFGLSADYWDRYAEKVNAVSKVDVQSIARKYLAADRIQIVAVGDPTKVAEPLRRLGAVQMLDTDGKAVADAGR